MRAGILKLLVLAGCAATGATAIAQTGSVVSYSSGTYTQDFSGLSATTSKGFSTDAVFAFGDPAPSPGASSMAGWYGMATGSNSYLAQLGGTGTTTGGFTAFGSSGTPQALGLKSTSTTLSEIFGVELVNTSSLTLTSFVVTFDAEAWWSGTNATSKTMEFGYEQISGTSSTLPSINSVTDDAALSFTGSSSSSTTTLTSGTLSDAIASAGASFINGTSSPLLLSDTISVNWTPGSTLWLTWSYAGTSSNSPGLAIGNLGFSALAGGFVAQNLTWNTSSGTWDFTTSDWTNGTSATTYVDGDNVTFGGTGGTVTVTNAGVSPASVIVANTSGTYTFTGGAINGAGSLTMNGAGTLVLSSSNGYTNGTNLNAGVVQISNDNQLGASTGALAFGGGTLRTTASINSARAITINAGGGTIDNGGNTDTVSGPVAINGNFTSTGSGNLILNGAVTTNTSTAPLLAISSGTLTLGQSAGTINLYADNSGTSFAGNLTISGSGGPRINFNSGNFGGGGQIQVQNTGVVMSNLSGATGGTISNNVVLNSLGSAFTKGDVTQPGYTPGNFVTTLGGTKGGGLTFNGVISGNSDVNIGNSSAAGGGAGYLALNAQNTYTGVTAINTGGTISLGVNNALPTTTDVINNTVNNGNATLDLHGFNQQVNSLSTGTDAGGSLLVTNFGSTQSILTVSGSTTPATAFSGVISDGSAPVAVVKAGSGTLILSGANSYSGGTTINAGTLVLSGNGTVGTGTVTMGGGTLDLSQVTNSQYSIANGQTLAGSGTINLGSTNLSVNGVLNPNVLTVNGGTLSVTAQTAFQFTLGALNASSVINLINGSVLETGSGILNLSEFTFSETTGFGAGTYVLIGASALAPDDSLSSTDLTENINGLNATLGFSGDNLVLTVVPEPNTIFLIGLGVIAVLAIRYRLQRKAGSY